MVETWEVMQKYNYRDDNACEKLSRLKKQGLIINLQRGHWELTVEGYRRLNFYAKKQKDT
jgi:Mn-dependent DtxR family transcriptional regulator